MLTPVLLAQATDDGPDYREIFGHDYEFALKTIEKNSWWSDSLELEGIDPHFALSVIFPELIRYSSISDFIETKALEVLYVQYGHEYANFSIGLYQIKPTFAEQVEADLLQCDLLDRFPSLSVLNPKITDNVQTRKERIIRLKDEYYQLLYLEAFIRIMDNIFSGLTFENAEEKLRFYATAYNTGYWKGEKVIRCESGKAYFHRGITEPVEKYSYSAIALQFFDR
jgi:hypothetical protein